MTDEFNSEISENQIKLFHDWNNNHECKGTKIRNTKGGIMVNLNNPIGPVVLIKCSYCNESLDITEYDNW